MLTTTAKRSFLAAGTLLLLAGSLQQALAQSPTTGGPTPQSPTATEVPLDGGASLLLAGGVAYGLRKLRQRRRR
ncbi:PID-CTERM protein-sorting domain-containing protein [Hymenobacter cheonanensis]|uniref:PID-CTERM protein-sorting domain-containing protein n=1 Tax=Hymenobacter sp. CA2-7 TaxID=3063993 RepID=UPI002713B09E|nr:hypothetical protein [Hymenobacter sp. CA2-7]MDO7884108.1 hypothetical protein [Hymenobacter sp. CA2-7]